MSGQMSCHVGFTAPLSSSFDLMTIDIGCTKCISSSFQVLHHNAVKDLDF